MARHMYLCNILIPTHKTQSKWISGNSMRVSKQQHAFINNMQVEILRCPGSIINHTNSIINHQGTII
jgi:hypothetical protein